jgi:formamidopyrimidine-DNA glycosylase
MPELPEVETIVRCLRPRLLGLKIKDAKISWPKLLRNRSQGPLGQLRGRKIIGLRRRGKMIRLDLGGGLTLLFHLKMTGQLLFCRRTEPRDKHTHFVISFGHPQRELRFRDVRKFGFILLLKTSEEESSAELRSLGPEPLEMGLAAFLKLLQGRRGRIKPLLLKQNVIAGIGNIYADEILFQAGIHPASEVTRFRPRDMVKLWKAMRQVLGQAIESRGTSIRDYRDGDGLEGSYQDCLCVYGRESFPCPRCGGKIKRLRIAGRSSHICPRCQRYP